MQLRKYIPHRRKFSWLTLGVTLSFVVTACVVPYSPPDKMVPKNKPEEQAEIEVVPEPEPEPEFEPEDLDFFDDFEDDEDDWLDDAFGDMDAALAERDQFMADQQLATDGSLLVAVTDAQKAFVKAQKEHIISQGGEFGELDEHIILALTSDACETAILNFHDASTLIFQSHVGTSPLIQSILSEVPDAADALHVEESLADAMVFGMKYMCPADYDDWLAIFFEIYE